MQHTHNKVGEGVNDFATNAHTPTEASNVGHQDEALFVHRLVLGVVCHVEEHHGAGPEHNQASMGNVGT